MKPILVCTVLFLIAQPSAAKSLPIESETATTEETYSTSTLDSTTHLEIFPVRKRVTTTTARVETTLVESTTSEPPPTLLTTTEVAKSQNSTLPSISTTTVNAVGTPKPSNANSGVSTTIYSPITNVIKNIGYGFRIVMKLLSPLFSSSGSQKKVVPTQEDVPDYGDFDDQDDSDDSNKALTDSFLRVVRQVAETGRQGYANYYDFIVNEYSYKFWAVYMLLASGLLIYSAIAAIYYAKFNTSAVDYEVYDEARSSDGTFSKPGANPLGLVGSLISVSTFQRIMDAISSEKFSERTQ